MTAAIRRFRLTISLYMCWATAVLAACDTETPVIPLGEVADATDTTSQDTLALETHEDGGDISNVEILDGQDSDTDATDTAETTEPADIVTDTTAEDATPGETTAADVTPADTAPSDTTSGETTDTASTSTDTTSADAAPPDTDADPCLTGPDRDGDGRVDACDACPGIPNILLYDLHSDHLRARAAIERLGCEYTVAGFSDFTTQLESGTFDIVVMELPDARPDGPWAQALLNHVASGGAAIVSGQRLNNVPGPSVPATLGASWGNERSAPVAFTPTWVVPVFDRPNALRQAGFNPVANSPWTWNGAPLTPTAGRVWARAADGAMIVESNGGRTFLNGFLYDDYPFDTDNDGRADVVELVANQIASTARALSPNTLGAPTLEGRPASSTVRHEMPILRGSTPDDLTEVTLHVGRASHAFPVSDRRFKALAPLARGENWVTLEVARGDERAFTHLELDYLPQTNPRKVRFVYAVASDGDGRFDAPFGEPDDLASAKRRLSFSARLLQSMLADRMAAAGLGQNTFELARDVAHEPDVFVWRTSANTAQWHGMDGLQMWSWIWGHIDELPACTDCKTVIVLGMTHYDAATGRALAHTALGGGGVALFGSATLHTFAESLDQLVDRFTDTRDVTTLQPALFDDSAFRRSMWANYATGLGAILHELAHAFDLPHAVPSDDIVNRGFDRVNRLVMSFEEPSAVSAGLDAIWPTHEPTFSTPNLGRLRWHRYNALDARNYTVNAPPTATLSGQDIRISAPAGVRVVGYARDVSNDWKMATGTLYTSDPPATTLTIPKSTVAFMFPNESRVRLYVTDDQGNMGDALIIPLP